MIGLYRIDGSSTSTGLSASSIFIGSHCWAPAGDFLSSQSYLNSKSKYPLSHLVGFVVHAPSIPLETVSRPTLRVSWFIQPRPCSEISAPSGAGPRRAALPFPCALPTVCPPAVNATVSSSFIAIRAKVSRTCPAVLSGSGFPLMPSGFT